MEKFKLQIIVLVFLMISGIGTKAQNLADTIKEKTDALNDRITGIDERLLTTESDLGKLKRIKLSGYVQSQYVKSENATVFPQHQISLRRVRVKVAYDAGESVRFVVQPDFIPEGFSLKDAYVQLNDPWVKTFSLWAGQFNRPNYEVEYSSSQRELPERSRVILALYPKERELGFKLEAAPKDFPLKLQLALFNGNIGQTYKDVTGANLNPTGKDFDNYKDYMLRATYSFKFGQYVGLDVGAHTYQGQVKSNTNKVIKGDYSFDEDVIISDAVRKSWFGLEFQLFADVLGGMSVKGEYLSGKNAMPGFIGFTKTTESKSTSGISGDTLTITNNITNITTNTFTPAQVKKFSGYYLYFVKNIGKKNQFAFRYDVYDPNTDLSGNDIGVKSYNDSSKDVIVKTTTTQANSDNTIRNITNTTNTTKTVSALKSGTSDIKYQTIAFAWQYYFDDNIRLTLAYEIPMNEKTGKNITTNKGNVITTTKVNNIDQYNDYSEVFSQNTLTLRLQVKF